MSDSSREEPFITESPSERLRRLAMHSPVPRRLPRKLIVFALSLSVILVAVALAASLLSDHAAEILKVWIDRILKNLS